MSIQKISTLHPDPKKQGVNISLEKYTVIKKEIEKTLREHGGLTFNQLSNHIKDELSNTFEGSIGWYVVTVKLDLEARGIVVRDSKSKPNKLSLSDR